MVVQNMPTILSTGSASNGDDHHHHNHSGLDSGNYEDHHHQTAKEVSHILARDLPSLHDSSYRLSALNGKVCRVRFFVNGDRHFRGLNYVVNLDRVKTLDLLCADLSRILVSVKTLPSGVRFILDGETGTPLESVHDLRVNGQYVCSSTVHFTRLNYGQLRMQSSNPNDQVDNSSRHQSQHLLRVSTAAVTATNRLLGMLSTSVQHPARPKHPSSNGSSLTLSTNGPLSLHSSTSNSTVRPKIVALLRGSCRAAPSLRPSRRAFRFLLNHRIAQNYEQLLNEISACVQLNVGAVHQIYGLSTAKKITCLDDFFDNEYVYLVYGRTEKCSLVDFMLDECEHREVASIVRPSYQFPVDLAKLKFTKRDTLKASIRFNLTPKERERHRRPGSNKRPRDGNNNDKDLKAFSLPRNFLANSHHRSTHQKIPINFYHSPQVGTIESSESTNGSGEDMSRRMAKSSPSKHLRSCEDSSCSSINSLREDCPPSRYYDLKNSNSDNVLSEMATNPNYRSQMYSTISNSLVFNTIAQHYPSLRSDDVYSTTSTSARHPSFSGSSTPGAASSVSCSEDFSYASVEPAHLNLSDQYNPKTVSFDDYMHPNHDDDDASSSDSSTPSFSSLSCVVRYPSSTPQPLSLQSTTNNSTNQSSPLRRAQPTKSSTPTSSSTHSSNNSTPRHQPKKSSNNNNNKPNQAKSSNRQQQQQHKVHSPEPECSSESSVHHHHQSTALLKPHQAFVPKKDVAKVYSVGEAIGDGKFGVVYTCTHRITGRVYALKVVDKSAMQEMMDKSSSKAKDSPRSTSTANSEAAILKRICHPNIVRIYDHFEFVDQSYLVLELFKGGDLFDAITAATKYSEYESVEMVNDLMQALAYLHRHNIVHRDIKLENLMVAFVPLANAHRVNEDGSIPRRYRQMIKLADFGLAVEIFTNELLFTVCGTPTYVAPEILLEIGYTFPVDIWAAGVIAYILLCGYPPFANEENDQNVLFDQIISGKFDFSGRVWATVTDTAKNLITAMLNVEQAERMTAQQVLKHEWLVGGAGYD